jgi:hypothetical protein
MKQASPLTGPAFAPGIRESAKIPTIKVVILGFLNTVTPREHIVPAPITILVLAKLSAEDVIVIKNPHFKWLNILLIKTDLKTGKTALNYFNFRKTSSQLLQKSLKALILFIKIIQGIL